MRLFGSCFSFSGMAMNRDIGCKWHVDDGDVLATRTAISLFAWGEFGGGELCMLEGGAMHSIAMGSEGS